MSPTEAEVTSVSRHGLWVLAKDKGHLLPYDKFPWFKDARLSEILEVELLHDFTDLPMGYGKEGLCAVESRRESGLKVSFILCRCDTCTAFASARMVP